MESSDPTLVTGDPADGRAGDRTTSAAPMGSAPRRTWLAAERTYLAWLRTGLASLGLAVAVGRLVPALIDASHVAFGLLGVGYGMLGIFLIFLAAYRTQRVRRALAARQPLPTDAWTMWVLTLVSLALALPTIILVAAEI